MKSTARVRRRRARLGVERLEDRTLLSNAIVTENQLPGTPESTWQVNGAGDPSLLGFATNSSVNHGQTVSFKIDDYPKAPYHIDIYRMGYYQGNGARLEATIPASQVLKQVQPAPLTDSTTGLIDAGNWAVSASWAVPATAVSGLYMARATRDDTGGASMIYFVVRADESHSDLLFQTSDSTWQAYNNWDGKGNGTAFFGSGGTYGGVSLYTYNGSNPTLQGEGRAYKVSYNRPLVDDSQGGGYGDYNSPLHGEYPMVRWLEANGYDTSYSTDVDSDRSGALIKNHKAFLSVGHDEYWSGGQRANVTAARDAGVNLAFFSGNESFWKTRWENSIDGSGATYRTLVCYKESKDNAPTDPLD
ncbi:MAG TPA: N,N-dimethylformamidase beta subunit family domain-containing protein, partial [Gemmataceae bacterium]|nr:N,N-dimethylformamidase beta subunit family domain-containing protein [Gemmataceae bacterium]